MCEMTEMTCCVCYIKHSIPIDLYNSDKGWNCPNGHSLVRSSKKTELQQLKHDIEQLRKEVNVWQRAAENQGKRVRELSSSIATKVATRAEVVRLKKKINAYKSTLKRIRKNGTN